VSVRVAAVQMCGAARPQDNVDEAVRLVREAAAAGATYVQTPEVTNIVQRRRAEAEPFVTTEDADPLIAALRGVAVETGIHVHVGSAVVRDGERWANRALLIAPDGSTAARYDKIHMFDVDLPDGTRFRESSTYAAGAEAVLAPVGDMVLGITICFDVRFPRLYEALAMEGATILAIPAAFAEVTGRAHWHLLVRARAVENGCFVVAATQAGTHADGRTTYGHALIVDPWGRVLAEADETPSVITADLDPAQVDTVRSQVPVLTARRAFSVRHAGPDPRRDAS
jgi:predicted amidohydrolase